MRPPACTTTSSHTPHHYYPSRPSIQPQPQQQQPTHHTASNASPFRPAATALTTRAVCSGGGVLRAVPREHLHHLGVRR